MKKIIFCLCMMLTFSVNAVERLTDTETLGRFAGMAAACGVGNSGTIFNKLAKIYIKNSSPTDKIEASELLSYKRAKYDGYVNTKNNMEICAEVVREFDNQDIFKFQVYSDGTLITSDKRVLMPRNLKYRDPNAKRVY